MVIRIGIGGTFAMLTSAMKAGRLVKNISSRVRSGSRIIVDVLLIAERDGGREWELRRGSCVDSTKIRIIPYQNIGRNVCICSSMPPSVY